MSKDNKDFFKEKKRWSEIKDQLLACYLRPYFQKLLTSNKPIFYVDCFAGKGKFDDDKPGSPLIALDIREKCFAVTRANNLNGAIQTCFIDLNYTEDLKRNIDSVPVSYDYPQIVPGKYEEQIESILRSKRDYNVFLYIDPYGIKALNSKLFDSFEAMGFATFEMLINFNSFGFFRDACRVMSVDYHSDEALSDLDDLVEYDPTAVDTTEQSRILLSEIAGGDYWMAIVRDYKEKKINGYQAERRLSTEYKQRLKQRYTYVLDMPICLKKGQRPKYRMIHVCNHEDGCFLMAQNIQSRKEELFINIQQNGQQSMFDLLIDQFGRSTEDDLYTRDDIKKKVLTTLSRFSGDISITKYLASFANEHGLLCDFNMIYDILDELSKEKVVRIIREPAISEKGRPLTFWAETKDKKVTIRRLQ